MPLPAGSIVVSWANQANSGVVMGHAAPAAPTGSVQPQTAATAVAPSTAGAGCSVVQMSVQAQPPVDVYLAALASSSYQWVRAWIAAGVASSDEVKAAVASQFGQVLTWQYLGTFTSATLSSLPPMPIGGFSTDASYEAVCLPTAPPAAPPPAPGSLPPTPIGPPTASPPPAPLPPAPISPPSPPSAPPPSPGACDLPCTTKCADLSVAWLALHYPGFVQAERSAAKTDYDILFDAYQLGVCEGDMPVMPECSVPYLERMAPEFVRAAKSQGKTDVEMLIDAAAIGLCAAPPPDETEILGTTAVEQLAPGSEAIIEEEFDPAAGTPLPQPGTTPQGSDCHDISGIVMPDLSAQVANLIPDDIKCLVGWDRVSVGLSIAFAGFLRDACACNPGGLFDTLAKFAKRKEEEWGITGKIVSAAVTAFEVFIRYQACNLQVLDKYFTTLSGIGAGESSPLMIFGVLVGAWERWIGPLPDALRESLQRAIAFAMPSTPPSSPAANALLASNFITTADWECIQRSHGERLDYQSLLVDLERERPTDEDLLILRRKNDQAAANLAAGTPQPTDPDPLTLRQQQELVGNLFQANGWTNQAWFDAWIAAKQWVPSETDAAEWLLKDLGDPVLRQTFGLNAEFNLKYQGHVKDVLSWNGVSETDARFLAMAHWHAASPGQMNEMQKRTRPGWHLNFTDAEALQLALLICPRAPRGDGAENELQSHWDYLLSQKQIGNLYSGLTPEMLAVLPEMPPSWREDITGDITDAYNPGKPYYNTFLAPYTPAQRARAFLAENTTTGFHVYEGLSQAGYPPFWRARLQTISYALLTRVDMRRAYETGQWDAVKLGQKLQDRGYAPPDADALVKIFYTAAVQLHSRRPAANNWVKTGFDTDLLKQALMDQGMRADQWDDVFQVLKTRRSIQIQSECLTGMRKRFVKGLLSVDDARNALAALPVDAARIAELINEWVCLRAAQDKQMTAAEVCLSFKLGFLTGQQAKRAMMNLGYNGADASRILSSCYVRKLPKTVDTAGAAAVLAQLAGL